MPEFTPRTLQKRPPAVEKEYRSQQGLDPAHAGKLDSRVDLTTGTAQVEGTVDLNALVAAVEEEGYGAIPVNR
jgi:hypothetical protein